MAHVSPLPHRDGIAPSFVVLPEQGVWPDILSFLLARFPDLPPAGLQARLAEGYMVDPQGIPVDGHMPYRPGTRLWYYREVANEVPVPFEATVLYRDDRLLVADKPHFLSTIPSGRQLRETLLTRLRHQLDLPDLTPIHRLDKETAGVVLFCLHPPSRGAYQSLFELREVKKEYEAVAPWRAELVLPLTHRSRMVKGENWFTMQEAPGEPNSETRIELMRRLPGRAYAAAATDTDLALYRLQPHTGKTHQLRVHMAALGIPIISDRWYPAVLPDTADDFNAPLQLLARSVQFNDPVSGELLCFTSQRELQHAVPE